MAALCLGILPVRPAEIVFKSKESKATLLELYSSEGCSSCPPAEAWIGKLKNAPGLWSNLFPVVFHVDYWDRLGWPDRFAQPAFTDRQQKYAELLGQDSVYTPEFIADGREWKGWFRGESVPAVQSVLQGQLTLTVDVDAGKVSANFLPSTENASQSYTLYVALLGFHVMTDVKRGENGGRNLQHDFVVLDFQSKVLVRDQGQDSRSGMFHVSAPSTDNPGAMVAWIAGSDGSICQVAGGWLKPAAL